MKTFQLAAIGLGLLAAQPALTHTELATTVPENNTMLAEAPETVELRFSAPVRLTALTLQRNGTSRQSLGPLPSEAKEHFTVALPELADGRYVVTWRAFSADTHIVNGEFRFAIGIENKAAVHGKHGAAPVADETRDEYATH
jgi:copper transport protein